MRLMQLIKERSTENLIVDGILLLILLFGAGMAFSDMRDKAVYIFATGQGIGEVVELYTEKVVQRRSDSKGNRLKDKTLLFPMAKVRYNNAVRSMRNTENLRVGSTVPVKYPQNSPSAWKPMRNYDLSPFSILFPGTKSIPLMMAYLAFWIFLAVLAFLIRLASMPIQQDTFSKQAMQFGANEIFTVPSEKILTADEAKMLFPDLDTEFVEIVNPNSKENKR